MRSIRIDLCIMGLAALLACGDDEDDGGASAAIASKLRECELVTEGKVTPFVADIEIAECQARCDAAGTCDELTQYWCGASPSARTVDCYNECILIDCSDGSGSYTPIGRCDGRDDCGDASDERDCPQVGVGPEYCAQSGDRIFAPQRCNGVDDCGDGTDEEGCTAAPEPFTCKTSVAGLTQQISRQRVCDLRRDCVDGSDESEEQGCGQLRCPR